MIDCNHITSTDFTAAKGFTAMLADFQTRGQAVYWLNPSPDICSVLRCGIKIFFTGKILSPHKKYFNVVSPIGPWRGTPSPRSRGQRRCGWARAASSTSLSSRRRLQTLGWPRIRTKVSRCSHKRTASISCFKHTLIVTFVTLYAMICCLKIYKSLSRFTR